MQLRAKERGVTVSVYLPRTIYKRLTALVEQGAYTSGIVATCLEKSLSSLEKEMKRQTETRQRTQQRKGDA